MGRHSTTNHSPSSRRDRETERGRSPSSRRYRSSHSHRDHDTSSPRRRSPDTSPPPPREKQHHSGRGSAKPVRESSGSPPPRSRSRSRSPSPQTKRLKRAQSDRERDRESERNHGSSRGSDRDRDRGRGSDRDTVMVSERKERRSSGRDGNEDSHNHKSSRSRHERSANATSPERHHHNGRSRHRSQSPQQHASANAKPRDEVTISRGTEHRNEENDSLQKMKAAEESLEEKQKQKPSFELSGKLAAETNRVRGVTLLFNEPPEARKPDIKWRLYVFKAGEVLNEPLYIHRQSCYLFGRERRVADIPTDHPSCSKQHAVIQFRQVEKEQPDGTLSKQIRPYVMDLGSTNKTFINDSPIEPQRYYELREQDTIKFGNSSREYVLLHENSSG